VFGEHTQYAIKVAEVPSTLNVVNYSK